MHALNPGGPLLLVVSIGFLRPKYQGLNGRKRGSNWLKRDRRKVSRAPEPSPESPERVRVACRTWDLGCLHGTFASALARDVRQVALNEAFKIHMEHTAKIYKDLISTPHI